MQVTLFFVSSQQDGDATEVPPSITSTAQGDHEAVKGMTSTSRHVKPLNNIYSEKKFN